MKNLEPALISATHARPGSWASGCINPLRSAIATLRERVQAITLFDLSVTATLLLLLLYGDRFWYVRVPTSALCIAGLMYPQIARHITFWMVMSAMVAAGTLANWYSADNHKYLMVYWCIALTCAMGTRTPAATLAISARFLIGLCFAFAAGWKLWSPDFSNGTFFQFCLLTDKRFFGFTEWVAGVPADTLVANAEALKGLTAWDSRQAAITLQGTLQVADISKVLAWWTILIELWVAAAFLAPQRSLLSRWRDVPLILFVLSTYAIATVAGFALVLIAMGLAQCRQRPAWIPLGYMASVFLLQLYMMPWSQILSALTK